MAQPTTLLLYHINHKIVSGIFTLHSAAGSILRSYSYTCRLTYDTSHPNSYSAGGEYPFPLFSATPVADRLFYRSGLSVARHGKFVTDGALFSCQSPINLLLFAIRPVCALRYYAYLLTSHVSPKPKLKKAKISMEFRLSSLIGILSYRIYETKSIGAGIVHI